MSCRSLFGLTLGLCLISHLAFADDVTAPTPSDTATSSTATPATTTAEPTAPTPAPVANATAPTELVVPDERLPTAKLPTFWQRHPLKMPDIKIPKIKPTDYKPTDVYMGVGMFKDMAYGKIEAKVKRSYGYLRVGRFIDIDQGIAINGGWRFPVDARQTETGYYFGGFFGKVMADSLEGKQYSRTGGGIDLSYQWTTPELLQVITVGIGAGRPVKNSREDELGAKPTAFIGYSISLKVL